MLSVDYNTEIQTRSTSASNANTRRINSELQLVSFFVKFLDDIADQSFFCCHWYPCFGLLVMSAMCFAPLVCFVIHSMVRFTSGSTPANLLTVEFVTEPFNPLTVSVTPVRLQSQLFSMISGGSRISPTTRWGGGGVASLIFWPVFP